MPNQLFVASYHQASAYARGKGAAPQSSLNLGELSDLELEVLGELAIKKVHATGVETTLSMVDVDLDTLLAFPDGLTEVFAELSTLEEPDAAVELAQEWAHSEEFDEDPATASRLLDRISEMALDVHRAPEDSRLGIYYLSAD